MEFIGTFPLRKAGDSKKADAKKLQTGPVFQAGTYAIAHRASPLARAVADEFQKTYQSRHGMDSSSLKEVSSSVDANPSVIAGAAPAALKYVFTRETDEALSQNRVQIAVHDMKDIPIEISREFVLTAPLKREDPRDALVTRSTYGAIQELPFKARIGTSSKRVIMQIRSLRADLDILPIYGTLDERLARLENGEFDAIVVPWASLRRMNLSPRYYVTLQVEQILPAACQGIVGVTARATDEELVAKLRYIEDSEASWASRCERAFLHKLGATWDAPVGAYAHRKGTQDPWILDTVIGDPKTGEVLRHREIGTSRCKPESLADKAFTGIISKGARKYLPFT